jgi:L-asparaginase
MRPATAIGADGPANLYSAVAAAASPGAKGRGVLVVLNDEVHAARNVTKTDTTSVETFKSPNRGPVGLVHTGQIAWFEQMDRRHTTSSEFDISGRAQLPRVDIIYAHANMSPDLIDAAVRAGAKGLVVAGVGDGNMTQPALAALGRATKAGVVVVRSTRLAEGLVLRNNEVNDDQQGFVASGEFTAPKARVLLQLALTKTSDVKQVQRMFNVY